MLINKNAIHLCNCETVKLLKFFDKSFFIYLIVWNSSVQLWNCETLEIFWQIIFHLSNSMEFICATVKLWDFWNFWTNYLSFILYYGIHLCYCETVRLLKLIQKYFFCLFIRMQFIFATVKLWDSWNFLTNNFCIYQIVCNSLCNSEPVRLWKSFTNKFLKSVIIV